MLENTTNSQSELFQLSSFPSAIMHLDCDAFFASVEQALKPELQGMPVVTGKERGIVACASYEAKALGVRRPMKLYEAKKMLPSLVCVPSDYEAYSLFSKRVMSIIRRFTPEVEEYSIDEAYANLEGLRRVYRVGYPEIAMRIKNAVQKELGITVSVGLSASKTLAKIASRKRKPDGFVVVRGREIGRFLETTPIGYVCGFGPNITAFLKKKKIESALHYIKCSESWAEKHLGKIGIELWNELRGNSVYPIVTKEKHDYASISKTKTFTPPSSEHHFLWAQVLRNLESAFIKLRRHRLRAGRISVYLKLQNFDGFGLEADLEKGTRSTLDAVGVMHRLFSKVFRPDHLYRATTVVLSKIEGDHHEQATLFEDPARIKALRALDDVIDGVNEIYGKHTLHLGTSLWLGKHRQHLTARGDLAQRKSELLQGESFRQRVNIPMWQVSV